jgi:hypothetical protein
MNDRHNTMTIYGQQWAIVADWLPADVSVTTLAALDASFSDLGNSYKDLLFVFRVSGAHAAQFVIDVTEDPSGAVVEDRASNQAIPEVPCSAGKQASWPIKDVSALGWRVSAYSSENGAPATTVNRRILGRRR